MNEGIGGVVLGFVGFLGVAYLGVKVRQNQKRLQRMVAVIDSRHTFETDYLFELADRGDLALYSTGPLVN
ncbi:hypothetical protein [Schlesneria sp. T3-172]|uniref:hypothetical protein n=1 Tax=Schlesneria sphaerica TaxID=3373610 RepID=UPI0037C5C0F1